MSNQTLRELAKDYARGEIDKDSYRKSRVELITAITAGKVDVKAIDFPPPLIPSEEESAITETAKREKTEIVSPSASQGPIPNGTPSSKQHSSIKADKKSPMLFITISTVIVITLIIVVVLFYPKPPGSKTTAISNVPDITQASTLDATTSNNMAGESLISDFLTQKNWTEDSLDTFLNSWSTLSQKERDLTKPTKRMQRLHASIYKQFLEEKALSSIDSEKAAMKQQKLIEFANAIGINDSRLILE
tara:strand:- start:1930 stop:2670 length:741 start_codon:yes stop_codon:yes gene_type:complete